MTPHSPRLNWAWNRQRGIPLLLVKRLEHLAAPLAARMRNRQRQHVRHMGGVAHGRDPHQLFAPHRLIGDDVTAMGNEGEVISLRFTRVKSSPLPTQSTSTVIRGWVRATASKDLR